jgi:hypothetical protein
MINHTTNRTTNQKTEHRKMLMDMKAPYLEPLLRQIETQSKITLARWALDYSAAVMLPVWLKYLPGDARPRAAISAARDWLAGSAKLPQVKPAILDCHAAARESRTFPAAQAAARAIGQSASTIHSARHCIGLALYGALAVTYDELGTEAPWEQLERRAAAEVGKMLQALQSVSVEHETNPARIVWPGK